MFRYDARIQMYMKDALVTEIKGNIPLDELQQYLKSLIKDEIVIEAIRIVKRR